MLLTERLRETVKLLRRRGSGAHAGWVEEAITELERLQWAAEPTTFGVVDTSPAGTTVVDEVGTGADDGDNLRSLDSDELGKRFLDVGIGADDG